MVKTYSERKKSCSDNETKGTLKNAKCFKPWNSQQQRGTDQALNTDLVKERYVPSTSVTSRSFLTKHKSGNQFSRSAQPQQSQRFQNQKLKGRRMKYNPNMSCDYCRKQGHEEINCYKLIGYRDYFQFTNNKGSQGQIRGNAAMSVEDFEGKHNNCSGNAALNQGYSKEQYNQFIHMFKQMKMEESADTSGGHVINANAVVGTILKYIGSCFSVLNSNTWIVDSGASEHMCYNSSCFTFMCLLKVPLTINLPNCHTIQVTHIGTVSLFSYVAIENVLYVPSFKFNLMSVNRFCRQFHSILFFTSNECVMQGPLMRRPQVFGEAKEGLYLLQPNVKESSFNPTKEVSVMSRDVPSSSFFPFNVSNIFRERKKSCLDNETKGTLKNAKCFKPWNSHRTQVHRALNTDLVKERSVPSTSVTSGSFLTKHVTGTSLA
ncbi:hypothetical protein H5410_032760 [Solanum commersonii]|uniref:Retrovirus-related Pol polyprotein from transposon TNT 1-94-like beta-barrel domain-containing protein n=1 Tax=Solanum commersonii TaxID=4109 RepID=A0A9J5YR69_SOLCO|nr:hypothetical protein H5410_032760 [Solanum commersonii]